METKKYIRKELLEIRNNIDDITRQTYGKAITETIRNLDIWKQADIMLAYIHFGSEVPTDYLIYYGRLAGKKVFAPRVMEDGSMEFYEIQTIEETEIGYQGIREPFPYEQLKFSYEESVSQGKKILMIMPGVGFSKDFVRMGYGKGFYDTYLSDKPEIYKMGICYECQLRETLPEEAHDRKPQMVITERTVL